MDLPYNLYMVTTTDELELPLCVGSSVEVARYLGVPVSRVYYSASRQQSGKFKGYKIFRIKEENEGSNDE